MKNETSIRDAAGTRAKITLAMIVCGIVVAAGGAANAANTEDGVPRIAIKYDPQSLNTDSGARVVYRRIVMAAELACPTTTTGSLFVNPAAQKCREQAVARAVQAVHSTRLVEIATVGGKKG